MAPIAQLVELRTFNPATSAFAQSVQTDHIVKPHFNALDHAEPILSNRKVLRYSLRYLLVALRACRR